MHFMCKKFFFNLTFVSVTEKNVKPCQLIGSQLEKVYSLSKQEGCYSAVISVLQQTSSQSCSHEVKGSTVSKVSVKYTGF